MKKTISLLLALLLCIGLTSPALAADAPFTDVPSTHWTYSEIMEAYADGAVNGVSANAYQPNGNVTMAQFIAILTRLYCPAAVAESTAAGAWYAPNYAVAELFGFFDDIPDYTPEIEITREVMAQIMYNLLMGIGPEREFGGRMPDEQERQKVKKQIPDFAAVASSAGDAVASCYYLGLITGVDSAGSFNPKDRMSRAQTAVIYVRLKQVLETGEGLANQTGTSAETSNGTLTNGKPVTEENVLALIEEYKNGKAPVWEKAIKAGFTSYKDGAEYDAYNPKYYSSVRGSNGIECAKFAYAFWDELFGDLPMREVTNYENIRPGDLIHYPGHWAIVTCKPFYEDGDTINLWLNWVGGGSSGGIGWQKEHNTMSTIINASGPLLDGAWTRYPN